HYEAASPERLIDYLEERERILLQEKEQLKKTIPQLKLLQTIANKKSQAIIFKGYKGVETALYSYIRKLPTNSELLLMGLPHFTSGMKPFYQGFFRHCINDKLLKLKIIANQSQIEQLQTLGLSEEQICFQDLTY